MTGTTTPASSRRRRISGTAAAAASLFTVTRTSSEPAAASAITCSAVPAGSAVSVLVIDCTTTGWPEPTRTLPTRVVTVARRAGKGMAGKIEARENERDAGRLAHDGGTAIFLRERVHFTRGATMGTNAEQRAAAAPPKKKRRWKLILAMLVVVPVLVFALYAWAALSYSYSKGERAGYLQKFSQKGWLCKTWEGEIAMATIPGTMPQIFTFTVRNDSI